MLIYIVQIIGAFFATICFSVLFNVSKKNLIVCGFIGGTAWLVYIICTYFDNLAIVFGNFIAALWIAVTSHIMARIKKTPVTNFFIPGILPFVPGGGMFRFVYNIIEGNNSLAVFYLVQTIEIAGVIALSIFIVDTIFRIVTQIQRSKKLKKDCRT